VLGSTKAFVVIVKNKEAFNPKTKDYQAWLDTLNSELKSIEIDTEVLRLAPVSDVTEQDEVLPAMVICTIKHDGRKKCRLVACGNFQKVQSAGAYAGVVPHDAWVQCLTLHLARKESVFQIDVSTAFLQTDECDAVRASDEGGPTRTFIKPPPVCERPKGYVWQVLKSIYGLKTAPRAWKQTLCRWLKEMGGRPAAYDDSVWVLPAFGMNILLYVDDLIVCGERSKCLKFLEALRKRFKCVQSGSNLRRPLSRIRWCF
jgi:hypothetical protein